MRKKSLRWTILTVAASCLLSACQLIPKEEELPEPPVLKSYEMVDYHQIPVCRGDLVQSKPSNASTFPPMWSGSASR